MKKAVIVISAIISLFVAVALIRKIRTVHGTDIRYRIGILQTASHPALNAVEKGFTEQFSRLAGHTYYELHNAYGIIPQVHANAQQLRAKQQFDAFFAIATPAAQSLHAVEKKRPIAIAAVTDPNAVGLVYYGSNICGSKDMIDVKGQVEMLIQLLPHAQKVGLLYTSGEANSVAAAKKINAELHTHGLQSIDYAVSSEADIQAMVTVACRNVDVILAPTDNTVAATIKLITTVTQKYKKPLIVSDNMLVKDGALAARGVDYEESGAQAARILYDVLAHNKKPFEIPIATAPSDRIVINQQVADELGVTIPASLRGNVTLIQ